MRLRRARVESLFLFVCACCVFYCSRWIIRRYTFRCRLFSSFSYSNGCCCDPPRPQSPGDSLFIWHDHHNSSPYPSLNMQSKNTIDFQSKNQKPHPPTVLLCYYINEYNVDATVYFASHLVVITRNFKYNERLFSPLS